MDTLKELQSMSLNVQVETNEEWCASRVSTGPGAV